MADTFSSHENLFTAVAAVWSGDSNKLGGGVTAQGVVARVQDLYRYQIGYDKPPIPSIAVEINSTPDAGFETNRERLIVTFHIYTQKDRAHGDQNAIQHQLFLKYHENITLTDGSNWDFGMMVADGPIRQHDRTADYNHFAQSFVVSATKS